MGCALDIYYEQIDEEFKDWLASDPDEESEGISLDFGNPKLLFDMIERFGGKVDDDHFDTNGWQWDWWSRAELNGKKIGLGGTGWDGSAKIYIISNEEWNETYE